MIFGPGPTWVEPAGHRAFKGKCSPAAFSLPLTGSNGSECTTLTYML